MFTVNIAYTVFPKQIVDLMVTAFEGGINYWAGISTKQHALPTTKPWYACSELWQAPFIIEFYDVEDPETRWTLDHESLAAGLQRYASKYPADFVRTFTYEGYEGDASDADVCFQIILLGELVYG